MNEEISTSSATNSRLQQRYVISDEAIEKWRRREEVAKAKKSLQSFIAFLSELPFVPGKRMLSMDLYSAFEGCCGIELPLGFQIEFGRQISKACREGRLPFRRKTVTRASLAAWEGLDESILWCLMRGEEQGA